MTTVDPDFEVAQAREARKVRLFSRINTADKWFSVIGLAWVTPILRAAAGDNPKAQVKEIWRLFFVPLLAILAFLLLWATMAPKVQTSLGAIPGPAAVWTEVVNLHQDAVRKAEREAVFMERVADRNQRLIDEGRGDEVKPVSYTHLTLPTTPYV